MSTSAPRRRKGPAPKSPSGLSRTLLLAAKVDPVEKAQIEDAMRRRGLPVNSTSLRELLLELVAKEPTAA